MPAPVHTLDLFVAVLGGVVSAGFFGVVQGVVEVALRDVGMMAGLLVMAGFIMFSGDVVMSSCVFVVLSSFAVVLRGSGEMFRSRGHKVSQPSFPSY